MARIRKRCGHVLTVEEMNDLMHVFATQVGSNGVKKMPYELWREISKSLADEWALYDVEWETDEYGTFIDIIYDGITWTFRTGDKSFGDFLHDNLLYDLERDMRVSSVPEYYTDQEGRQYYEYYDTRMGKSTVYSEVADSLATKADVCELARTNEKIHQLCESAALAAPLKNENKTNTEKENFAMKFNFDFGPVNSSTVRMSLYGLAVKNKAGTWVSYDAKAGDIMDVDILNFDGAKFLYKMPVATKDIAIGDVVIHNGIPMFVIAIATNGTYITGVDPVNGERKDIMLPKSPFGFNFATKVVNFLGNLNTGADASNPFGNLGLMLMLNDSSDMNDLLPLMLLSGNTGTLNLSDPTALMFMGMAMNKNSKSDDNILPMLLMLNAQKPVAPVTSGCTCGHTCENHTQG